MRVQVEILRGLGVSWLLIGMALGITAEGARSRYARAALIDPDGEPSRFVR
jgi:hypothetical protein